MHDGELTLRWAAAARTWPRQRREKLPGSLWAEALTPNEAADRVASGSVDLRTLIDADPQPMNGSIEDAA